MSNHVINRIKFVLTVLVLLGSQSLFADTVTLHDGRWVEGRVEEVDGVVKVHLKNGTVTIPPDRIKDIFYSEEGKLTSAQKKVQKKLQKEIEELRKHSMWRDRYVEETKHFVFNYNVTPEIAEGYIELLEGFYKDFSKKLGVKLSEGVRRKKMEINICRDRDNYVQIGGAPGTAGYFNFVDERLFFYHDRSDPEFALGVLIHEFTHLLIHLIKPKFCHPIWCNEGMAEYFRGSSIKDNKLTFGGILEDRLSNMNNWRKEGNDYHLEELIRTQPGGFGGIEYGWAWSFIHFVMENKKYKKRFMKYFIGLAKGSGVKRDSGTFYYPTVLGSEDVKQFKKAFGVKNLDKLNKEWHEYIDKKLKVSTSKGYLYEARSNFHNSQAEEALESITKAEESWEEAKSPYLYYLKGRILAKLDKHIEAEKAFRQAIELDPINGRYFYYLGDAIAEKTDPNPELKKQARQYKKLALELEPTDYDLRHMVENDLN